MSLLMFGWWLYVVLTTFMFGPRGLNVERYQDGVLLLGGAAVAGFMLIWAIALLLSWQRNRRTGFEASVVDEFGTVFEMTGSDGRPEPFKLSLGKFVPQLIGAPDAADAAWAGMTPLEADLIGFLNAYRHWPLDLEQQKLPADKMVSLYDAAFARWQVMRHLPGSGPWHRVMALAKDLALVHAYKEQRVEHPFREFWRRDDVVFSKRCAPHGGMAAFVLSTMPAFRALAQHSEGQVVQRALLTALRYHATPALLPINGGPLARELVDFLWRADAQLKLLDVGRVDQIADAQLASLREDLGRQWLALLASAEVDAGLGHEIFKQANPLPHGTLWLRQDALLGRLGPLLSAELRQALELWDVPAAGQALKHPAWPHVAPLLLDLGLIANSHDGVAAVGGCFTLQAQGQVLPPMVKLVMDDAKHLPVLREWKKIEGFDGPVDVILEIGQLGAMATTKALAVDERIGALVG
ncbi:MAG: hypothetical protein EBR79_03440 [Proteobacteria bacterium]|nr:hypothetical protein [Pseudomonadota bacterium]